MVNKIYKFTNIIIFVIMKERGVMKSYSSREIIKLLKKDGWYEVPCNAGSHIQFKHSIKKGRVTVKHPCKDIPIQTLKSIERQAQLLFDK